MNAKIVFHAQAKKDLSALYTYIRERSGPRVAKSYTDRIRQYCLGFATFPKRGTLRPDLGATVRLVGFQGRVSIAFSVQESEVVILGIFYGGRSIRIESR